MVPRSARARAADIQRHRGPADRRAARPGALERSLNELVRRHESLRTSFVAIGGTPQQVVAPDVSLSIEMVDLTELPLERSRSTRPSVGRSTSRGGRSTWPAGRLLA